MYNEDRGKSNSNIIAILLVTVCAILTVCIIFVVLIVNNSQKTETVVVERVEKTFVTEEKEEDEDIEEVYPAIPVFDEVLASSTLPNALGYTYYASNVLDKNTKTAWNEGATDVGIGESLTFFSSKKQSVSGIRILNGYCQDTKTYYNNNRVKTMRIWFSNGNSYEYVINDAFGVYTDIEFVEEQVCDMVVLTILDVYRGYKYNDTCISEVEFF